MRTRSRTAIEYVTHSLCACEGALGDDFDAKAPRDTAMLRPLKLIIDNFPENLVDECSAPVHPHHLERSQRSFPITRQLWIEAEDFMEPPTNGYFHLFPGKKVRLRYGYVVECTHADKDDNSNVIAVHCNYFAGSKGGTDSAYTYKVKGNFQWVSATHEL